jgi:ADP-ribosylglycohydrolase
MMIGAICGDFIGSVYEHQSIKSKDFPLFHQTCRFTDDTVLTVATMDALINKKNFTDAYKFWYRKYPQAGYGGSFIKWAAGESQKPYNSWGNGSAMRVSPIGVYYQSLEDVLDYAEKSASVTHNHPEGIKGAQATATCIFLAKQGESKKEIEKYIEYKFNYSLDIDLDKLRKEYSFDVSCQGSVPQSIACFLQSTDYEDAVRNAVSLGGDSDTMACIAGGIAEAFYDMVPEEIKKTVWKSLPVEFQQIIDLFYMKLKNLK